MPDLRKGLTAVAGVMVGHDTMPDRPTGCTVVLSQSGAVAGVDVRGSAPGTRETDLLHPINTVQVVHAIVLSGGSAFGLDASSGVMRFLEQQGIGFDTRVAKVPIVPSAVLFDLNVGDRSNVRPDAESGYRAAKAASDGPVAQGNVGAGTGATVGKLGGYSRAMKGGIGTKAIGLQNGLVVAALVAVNAVGDIIDPRTARVIAGMRTTDGRHLADARTAITSGFRSEAPIGTNTTIGVVATNAKLTKSQITKVAQMAHDGLAKAIFPAHTTMDGDTMFAISTGTWDGEPDLLTIGALAVEVTAESIVNAVRNAESIPGYPAAREMM
jgi:L-aminopeptidase/D-esterase-like protein